MGSKTYVNYIIPFIRNNLDNTCSRETTSQLA